MKNVLKLLVTAALLGAAVWAAYRLTRPAELGSESGGRAVRPEPVKVAPVTRGMIRQEVSVTGEVMATARVDLAPKVTGRLIKLMADEGAVVRKGDLVAALDTDTFQAEVDRAAAAVSVAQANVKNADIRRENAEREYKRVKSLFDQGTSPQASLDDAEAAYKVAASVVDVAKANEVQARSALELAEIQLREASLYAPFDATVSQKLLDVGAYVSAGTPVLELVSIDTVKVLAGVSEQYLADIEVGKTSVSVTVDALKGRSFPGVLYRVSPTLEASTRTADVDIRIENTERLLKPGMYARVTLVTKQKAGALLLPRDALLGREGAYYAYTVEQDRVRRADVAVGLRGSQAVEILSGLSEGASVVISGEGNLYDGARVSVEEARFPSTESALGGAAEAGK